MINVVKLNDENKGDLDVYFQGVVMGLFPKIGSYISEAGEAVSEYWSKVNINRIGQSYIHRYRVI